MILITTGDEKHFFKRFKDIEFWIEMNNVRKYKISFTSFTQYIIKHSYYKNKSTIKFNEIKYSFTSLNESRIKFDILKKQINEQNNDLTFNNCIILSGWNNHLNYSVVLDNYIKTDMIS